MLAFKSLISKIPNILEMGEYNSHRSFISLLFLGFFFISNK